MYPLIFKYIVNNTKHKIGNPLFVSNFIIKIGKNISNEENKKLRQDSFKMREQTFITEMGRKPESIFEGDFDQKQTTRYLVGYINNQPVSTTAIEEAQDHIRLRKIAVIRKFQGLGLGHTIVAITLHLSEILAMTKEFDNIKLCAVVAKVPFYESFGFTKYGDLYTHPLDSSCFAYWMSKPIADLKINLDSKSLIEKDFKQKFNELDLENTINQEFSIIPTKLKLKIEPKIIIVGP